MGSVSSSGSGSEESGRALWVQHTGRKDKPEDLRLPLGTPELLRHRPENCDPAVARPEHDEADSERRPQRSREPEEEVAGSDGEHGERQHGTWAYLVADHAPRKAGEYAARHDSGR